jgi:ATP-dependent DNA helicase RecQ
MDSEQKIVTQNDFMDGNIDIIVATSAFGMGVDKDNVSMVIHYEISDSLENYVQEAGRAGRKEDLDASCYILFDEKDLNKHFALLNNTKLNHKEIAQIWRGIKNFKREKFTKSALEIAKSAGWDAEMKDLDTRVKTAISTLEDSGYVERGQNSPRIFANSFLIRDVSEANKQIDITDKLDVQEKITAKRIFQHLVSHNDTKVDYMAEILGIAIEEVSKILNILKEIKVIGDTKDLTAFIDLSRTRKNSQKLFILYKEGEQKLIELLTYPEDNKIKRIHLKEINEKLIESGIQKSSIEILRNIIRYWSHKDLITRKRIDANNHTYDIHFKYDYIAFKGLFERRIEAAEKVLDYLHSIHKKQITEGNQETESVLIEFSLMEIKTAVENSLFSTSDSLLFYEGILLYLHETGSVKLESGLLICYNSFTITRLEQSNQKQFTKENYKKLESYYENKIEQIHIVGEYARKILESYEEAMTFVDNYFRMEYKKFINRYFPERKTEIKRPLTEMKFKEIFGTLSTQQLNIIKDNINKHILVLAGPGSGKTRILVHKIASLLLLEDIKPEQFLMLTFSRSAAMEFKNRLVKLVGNVGYYIDIFTYHSFAFNLLGRLGSLEKSDKVIQQATDAILTGELSDLRIDSKSVLVVDEYQDIGQDEFNLLNAIIKQAEDIRVIVVGDDDQNIYEFRGSSSRYMKEFKEKYDSEIYYLDTNYRSQANIVDFSNLYLRCLPERMKEGCTLRANTKDNGSIKIIKYKSGHLIMPLTEHIISSELPGTTAVLTNTNEEAMLVETVLKQRGVPAKLILANEGFPLKNLVELRTFTHYISKEILDELGFITEDLWIKAKEKIKKDYDRSIKSDLVFDIIHRFEKANPRKFKSEWKSYLEEIRIEEFYFPDKDIILVSTMHKAKGKEFDNVFLLLNNYILSSDEKKRVLYVAITRTKKNLFIHTNQDYFDKLTVENFDVRYDDRNYGAPESIVIQLSLKDVNLNFQKNQTDGIRKIQAGDELYLNNYNLLQDKYRKVSIKYAKSFEEKHNQFLEKGYHVHNAEAGYVVVWMDIEESKECRILLPKILYKRNKVIE